MREHPIPQDIVGYRFHIVGSMTLKQFAELAIGAILGFLVYLTNLPFIIKGPLILTMGLLGVAAAFLPIAERPLDHWITTFFKTLYRPTKFYWKRSSKIPNLFNFKPGEGVMETKDEIDLTPARKQRIKDYLASVNSFQDKDELDQQERAHLDAIMDAFGTIVPKDIKITKEPKKPNLKLETRSITKKINSKTADDNDRQEKKSSNFLLNTHQVAGQVEIPVAKKTKILKKENKTKDDDTDTTQQQAVYATSSDVKKTSQDNEEDAIFNASLPFPSKPDQPNKIVGMILTPRNELIPEAVIEIKDEQSRVVRAVKSNALGQFFISTALKNGNYDILVKHPKYKFNPQEIALQNKVVEPIEIRSLN